MNYRTQPLHYYLVPLVGEVCTQHNGHSGGIAAVLVAADSPEAARGVLMLGASRRAVYASPLFGYGRMLLEVTGSDVGTPEPFSLGIFAARRNGWHEMNVLTLGQGVPPQVAVVGRLEDVVASLNRGMLQI